LIKHTIYCDLCKKSAEFDTKSLREFIGLDMSVCRPLNTDDLNESDQQLMHQHEVSPTHICLECVELLHRNWEVIFKMKQPDDDEPPF
jgi:hypothetical protein